MTSGTSGETTVSHSPNGFVCPGEQSIPIVCPERRFAQDAEPFFARVKIYERSQNWPGPDGDSLCAKRIAISGLRRSSRILMRPLNFLRAQKIGHREVLDSI